MTRSDVSIIKYLTDIRQPMSNIVLRACNYHLRILWHIHHTLTFNLDNKLACSIVGMCIDYYAAPLFDAAKKNISKL